MNSFIYKFLCKLTYTLIPLRRHLINLLPYINISKETIIEPGVLLRPQYGGGIFIGERCRLSKGAQIITNGGDVHIGDNSTVNPYTVIYGSWGG